jgi:outer membrane protein assembly factor BamA
MRWVLVCLLVLPSSSWAQRPAKKASAKPQTPTARSWPIETISIEGNNNYTDQQILAVSGLKAGQPAGEPQFEAARQRLLDTGAFEAVGYRYEPSASGKGFNARLIVAEIAQVYPVRFENLNASPGELQKHLRSIDPLYSPKIAGTSQILERYARALETYLARKGQSEKIVGVLTPDGADLYAVFRPAAAPPVVAEVKFHGNQVLPNDALQLAVSKVAVGSPYNERRMREILDMSVRPLYEARGRIRVVFPKIRAERAKDVSGVAVAVNVAEGDSYDLGEVSITGTSAPEAALRKAAAFKSGEMANFDEIRAAIDRMHQLLRGNGYMTATSQVDRKIDDEKKVVDLAIRIEDGPQYTFGKLEVKGLDLHGEAAIPQAMGAQGRQTIRRRLS